MQVDWQTLTAVVIVLITLAIFASRLVRRGKKPGCGGDCGCGKQPPGPGRT